MNMGWCAVCMVQYRDWLRGRKAVRTVPGSVEWSVVLCVEARQWRAGFT